MAIPPSSFATLGSQLQSETAGLVPHDGNAGFILDMADKGALMGFANAALRAGQEPSGENMIQAATAALTMGSLKGASGMAVNSAGFGGGSRAGSGSSYSATSAKLAAGRAEATKVAETAASSATASGHVSPFMGFAVTSTG